MNYSESDSDELTFKNDLSDDSDDALRSEEVEELLRGLSFRNAEDTKIDSILLNRSYAPVIDIFPEIIKFPPTFPNVPLSQKITISNSGKNNEKFRISINGNDAFKISNKEIEIQQGTTSTLLITFVPKSVSMYSASLIIEGRKSFIAPITAHCINSPLVFPPINSDLWYFKREETTKEFVLMNESVSLPLIVSLETNSALFELSEAEIEIPPKKSVPIKIVFRPNTSMVDIDPFIKIECEKSGDKIKIPLRIAPPMFPAPIKPIFMHLSPLSKKRRTLHPPLPYFIPWEQQAAQGQYLPWHWHLERVHEHAS